MFYTPYYNIYSLVDILKYTMWRIHKNSKLYLNKIRREIVQKEELISVIVSQNKKKVT